MLLEFWYRCFQSVVTDASWILILMLRECRYQCFLSVDTGASWMLILMHPVVLYRYFLWLFIQMLSVAVHTWAPCRSLHWYSLSLFTLMLPVAVYTNTSWVCLYRCFLWAFVGMPSNPLFSEYTRLQINRVLSGLIKFQKIYCSWRQST